jgi:hypothetical protein
MRMKESSDGPAKLFLYLIYQISPKKVFSIETNHIRLFALSISTSVLKNPYMHPTVTS